MTLELQYRINQDIRQKQFLRENSHWYKYLNRNEIYYKDFIDDMKDKYKLKPTDKRKDCKLLPKINKVAIG